MRGMMGRSYLLPSLHGRELDLGGAGLKARFRKAGYGVVVLVTFPDQTRATVRVAAYLGKWEVKRPLTEQQRRWMQSALTRLAQILPTVSHRIVQQPRPKGTSEVAECTTETSDLVHGGSSASEEVPDGQGGGHRMPLSLSGCAGSSIGIDPARPAEVSGAPGSDEAVPGVTASDRAGVDTADAEAVQAARAVCTEGTGSHAGAGNAGKESRPGESSTLPSPGAATTEQAAVRVYTRSVLRTYSRVSRGTVRTPSLGTTMAFGGAFASLLDVQADPALTRRMRRVLARILPPGESDAGPRWNPRKIATRTAGYLRPWTVSDRRDEAGVPAILVLPDVSGSMSAFAGEVTRLAASAGRLGVSGADVIIVVHSNGFPLQLSVNGQPPICDNFPETVEASISFYLRIVRRYSVRAVLVAADWDGEWLYRQLASLSHIERLIWLDVWSSSRIGMRVVPFPPRWAGKLDWPEVAMRKVRYAFGCATAMDAVEALEEIANKVGW